MDIQVEMLRRQLLYKSGVGRMVWIEDINGSQQLIVVFKTMRQQEISKGVSEDRTKKAKD